MTLVLVVLVLLLVGGLAVMVLNLTKLVKNLDTNLSIDPNVSLQEVLKSLELAATVAAKVAKNLEINVAEARQQFTRLVVLLDRLQMDMTASGLSDVRMEAQGARSEAADAQVASDLSALQKQARTYKAGRPPPVPGSVADSIAGGFHDPEDDDELEPETETPKKVARPRKKASPNKTGT